MCICAKKTLKMIVEIYIKFMGRDARENSCEGVRIVSLM